LQFFPGTIRASQVAEFLRAPRAQLRGPELFTIWDHLNTNKAASLAVGSKPIRAKSGSNSCSVRPQANLVEQIYNFRKN
jgi:hypothetical protein